MTTEPYYPPYREIPTWGMGPGWQLVALVLFLASLFAFAWWGLT